MNLERTKEYIQNYLNDVIVPNLNKDNSFVEPITMTVNSLRIGSYNPPIFHVFVDVDPIQPSKGKLKRYESDISDFLKIFSIDNRVKVHWNKRPLF